MRLRTRLVLGYGFLVVLLLLAAGTAIVGFFNLAGTIESIVDDNVQTVRTSTRLLESLERQDSATLEALLREDTDATSVEESGTTFLEELEKLQNRATTESERTRLQHLQTAYDSYRSARDAVVTSPSDTPLSAYRNRVLPKFRRVKTLVFEILSDNHETILSADRTSETRALQFGSWMGFLVVVALFAFVLLTRGLRDGLLDRLDDLRDTAEAIETGDDRRRVSVTRNDELGAVARTLNRAMDRVQELESEFEGRRTEMKQLLLGLLETEETPAALYGPDARLMAHTLGDQFLERLPPSVENAIAERGSEISTHGEGTDGSRERMSFPEAGVEAEIISVRTPEQRRIGWLVRYLDLPAGSDDTSAS